MGDRSAIEWTEATWNPVTGCSKVSPGCAHCYAERIELRFGRSLKPWTPENAAENVRLHPERLEQPLRWRKPRMVFVNSMSDLFHELVPFDFIDQVFDIMLAAEHHTFQILTKRPERMLEYLARLDADQVELLAVANVWLGTSIENRRFVHRADALRSAPAAVRFISAEPLLGPIADELDLTRIDWLIVGGESGEHHRPIRKQWVRDLRDKARAEGVPFFFKQWGGKTAKSGGRELDDRTWDELPLVGLARQRLSPESGQPVPAKRMTVPGG